MQIKILGSLYLKFLELIIKCHLPLALCKALKRVTWCIDQFLN